MSERYGFSLTTFRQEIICAIKIIENIFVHFNSPSGKLVQIEYALNAVAAGAPSVGIKGDLI